MVQINLIASYLLYGCVIVAGDLFPHNFITFDANLHSLKSEKFDHPSIKNGLIDIPFEYSYHSSIVRRSIESNNDDSVQPSAASPRTSKFQQINITSEDSELYKRLKNGINGKTYVIYKDSNRKFVIMDRILYECDGLILNSLNKCHGNLVKFNFTNDEDYCYNDFKLIVDKNICFGSGVEYLDGDLNCVDSERKPMKWMKLENYQTMCKNVSHAAKYNYFPDRSEDDNPEAKPIRYSYHDTDRL